MPNVSKTFLSKDAKIKDALKILDEAIKYHIALVVDDNKKLIGTITDGDLRRGFIKGFTPEDSVSEVMNKNPVTLPENTSNAEIKNFLIGKKLRQIILADNGNIVKNIVTLDCLLIPTEKKNKVFLMVGGLGTRLRPLTDDKPKPMLEVGGKPILETIIANFIKEGFRDFYLSLNYKGEVIKNHFGDGSKFGCNIEYIEETKRMGTAGALSLIPEIPEHPMIVMNGDLLTKAKFSKIVDFHDKHEADATMGIREYNIQIPFGVVDIEENEIKALKEKPTHNFFVNAGIYVVSPDAIKEIPKDEFYDMPTLFDNLRNKSKKTLGFPVYEYWIDIGRKDQLDQANREFHNIF